MTALKVAAEDKDKQARDISYLPAKQYPHYFVNKAGEGHATQRITNNKNPDEEPDQRIIESESFIMR